MHAPKEELPPIRNGSVNGKPNTHHAALKTVEHPMPTKGNDISVKTKIIGGLALVTAVSAFLALQQSTSEGPKDKQKTVAKAAPSVADISKMFETSLHVQKRTVTFQLPPGTVLGKHASIVMEKNSNGPPVHTCIDDRLHRVGADYSFVVPDDVVQGETVFFSVVPQEHIAEPWRPEFKQHSVQVGMSAQKKRP